MKSLWAVIVAAGLAGCAGTYNPDYYFNYVEVINLSGGSIRDVSLRVNGSPKAFACEQVNRNAICEDRFGKRRYPQQGIDLSWVHPDGSTRSDTLTPAIPAYFGYGLPLQIYLEIRENGSVEAYYKQEEPGRDGGSMFISLR